MDTEDKQHVYSTSTVISPYRPPTDAAMGPPSYPPAQSKGPSTSTAQEPTFHGNTRFKGGHNNEMWTLDPSQVLEIWKGSHVTMSRMARLSKDPGT